MDRLGVPEQPWTRVIRSVFAAGIEPAGRAAAALSLVDDPDPAASLMAWQWAAVLAENQGDVDDARTYVEKALGAVDGSTTPWQVATLHTQLALLDFNAGLHHEAARHAATAVPLLERLHADDDATSMRISIALSALRDGDLDEAQRILDAVGEPEAKDITGGMVAHEVRAEILVARGDVEGALRAWSRNVEAMRAVRFPGVETAGDEPWSMVALGTALTAHVRYAETPTQRRTADDLAAQAVTVLRRVVAGSEAAVDYPVTGITLAGLAVWLLTVDGGDREAGARLLALARGFSYNRWFPVMDWEPLVAYAEAAAPGRLASWLEAYDGRRGGDLRGEVGDVLGRLTSSA
jgi:tetratricopeptide (TPR) repeat protein